VSKAEINNLNDSKPPLVAGGGKHPPVACGGRQEDIANVLIADNDSELARFMLEILARKGIRGHLANDVDSAIDFINKGSCDLVFTSNRINQRINMSSRPQDGFELLEIIKANWPELPVIMITKAKNRSPQNQQRTIETAVRAIRLGCCDFLIKPLDCEKIETLLDTFLPNHSVLTVASAHEDTRCLYGQKCKTRANCQFG